MTETKHTPGPWTYFVGNANGRGLIRVETDLEAPIAGLHICSMPRGKHQEANATLIAAAPDLLKALKVLEADCTRGMESGDWGNFTVKDWPELQAARAAIAKGESQ